MKQRVGSLKRSSKLTNLATLTKKETQITKIRNQSEAIAIDHTETKDHKRIRQTIVCQYIR